MWYWASETFNVKSFYFIAPQYITRHYHLNSVKLNNPKKLLHVLGGISKTDFGTLNVIMMLRGGGGGSAHDIIIFFITAVSYCSMYVGQIKIKWILLAISSKLCFQVMQACYMLFFVSFIAWH